MNIRKLSIVIPSFNEAKTIGKVIERVVVAVRALGMEGEIVVVDDGSTDDTKNVVENAARSRGLDVRYIAQDRNRGKGAALKRGFQEVAGDIVIVQDADLEYDPSDYGKLLEPFLDERDKADVVYGSRFQGDSRLVVYGWLALGNRFLTFFSNVLTGLSLTDMETGYKVFRREVLDRITPTMKSSRFGIEPELTAKIAKGKWRVFEVPIKYHGRTYEEGKKIGWWDGFKAIGVIIYFRFFD